MANRKTGNIVSMKRRRSKTLGVILCLFSLYLLVMFIMSMTKDHLSIYEVNETQIADDETIRGLILRDEVLVNTQRPDTLITMWAKVIVLVCVQMYIQ